jgi:hypothetical protein
MRVVKRLREHRLMGPLAWLVTSALFVGAVAIVPARPARAADVQAQRAVVLDFASLDKSAPLAGAQATSALALRLTDRGVDVTSAADVQAELRSRGIKPPFDESDIITIQKDLDVKSIYSGAVVAVEERLGQVSTVRVVLRIEVYDGATGDMINGAYAEGFETLKGAGTAEREAGRATAIDRALAKSLNTIDARSLIGGAVLSYSPTTSLILINRGSRNGVTPGMEFDVFRVKVDPTNPNRSVTLKVGKVRATEVSSDEAYAAVVESTQGVSQYDTLREIFRLPAYSPGVVSVDSAQNHPPRGGSASAMGWLGPLGGILAGGAILAFLLSMHNNTVTSAPVASATAGAYLTQSSPGQLPSVQVNWGDKDFAPPPEYIGGYIVYRGISSSFGALDSDATGVTPGGTQRSFSDDPTWEQIKQNVQCNWQVNSATTGNNGTGGGTTTVDVLMAV